MIEIDIKLEPGAVNKISERIVKIKAALEAQSASALKNTGEIYYEIVVSHMGESQGGELVFSDTYWQELSDVWLQEKREQGWVQEVWEATGETKGAVRVFGVEKTAGGWSVFVGLKDVDQGILQKALENEFGVASPNRNVPARPLFEPAKRELAYNDAYRDRIVDVFKKATTVAMTKIWK
jgi:hypothetical protein